MNSGQVDALYIGKAKNIPQRLSGDESGFFAADRDAWTGALTLARQWGERHRRGHCGVVAASRGRLDDVIESMSSEFSHVPLDDLAAIEAAVSSQTVAIILEPIQCDSVTVPASQAYVRGVERLCHTLNILLILKDAPHLAGRCGGLSCEDTYGICADIVVSSAHTQDRPRSAALLARGHARTTRLEQLAGWVKAPDSARFNHPASQRQWALAVLTA